MSKAIQLINEFDVKWVDLRFTDTKGKQQHITMPARDVDDEFFEEGKMFDGSSIAGWKGIEASDMILMPEDFTACFNGLLTAVQSGEVSEERIDESLTRILTEKLGNLR